MSDQIDPSDLPEDIRANINKSGHSHSPTDSPADHDIENEEGADVWDIDTAGDEAGVHLDDEDELMIGGEVPVNTESEAPPKE